MAKLTIESRIYDTSGLREKIQRILSEHNHMELAGDDIVRIPKIQGRIFERENGYGHVFIDLIYQRWYDPEARQSRNRKTTIGEMLDICPTAMIPTPKYTEFFDLETGELLKPFDDEEESPADQAGKGKEKKKTGAVKAKEEPRQATVTALAGEEPEPRESNRPQTEESPPAPGLEQKNEEPNNPAEVPEDEENKYKKGYEDAVESIMNTRRRFAEEKRLGDERKEEEEREQELYGDEPPETEEDLDQAENELRAAFGLEPKPPVQRTPEELELEREYAEYMKARERMAILRKVLEGIQAAIRNQARKHPNDIVNEYKVRKTNEVLTEIREKYRNSEYIDLLDLMEEPKTLEDADGELTVTGMTYSDAEVLLSNYETILKFIQVDKKPKREKLENL